MISGSFRFGQRARPASVRPALVRPASVRPASVRDVRDIIGLLASVVPDCSEQTVWDVPWSWPTFWVRRSAQGELVATGALLSVDDDRCELRGLAVAEGWRGRGIAGQMVATLLAAAQARGKDTLCVTRQPAFFEKRGFVPTHPFWLDLAPARHPTEPSTPRRVPMIAPCPRPTAVVARPMPTMAYAARGATR